MSGRRLDPMDIREVLLQLRSTQSNRAVARATGTDRRTVQRYRQWASQHNLLEAARPLPPIEELQNLLNQNLPSKPPPQTVSSVEVYRSLVEQWHRAGVEGTAIWQRLAEQGYTGTLYRPFIGFFVALIHPSPVLMPPCG